MTTSMMFPKLLCGVDNDRNLCEMDIIDGVFVGVNNCVNHILIVIGLDMTTVDYLGHHGFWIELKWSPSCLANYGVFHIGIGFPRRSMDVI